MSTAIYGVRVALPKADRPRNEIIVRQQNSHCHSERSEESLEMLRTCCMTIRAFAHSTRGISPQPDSSGCDEVATEGISSKGS